jgi:ParB family chromosome partitioning protein
MNEPNIVNVPIAEIFIANPRSRNRKRWLEIVASIRTVGLKRPITVSRRVDSTSDGKRYDLVCGQGRIEAFVELGESSIPTIVTQVSREDQYLMSLIENIARRQPSNRGILLEVKVLRARDYSMDLISEKLGLDKGFIYGLVNLIERGEETLVEQVEAGKLPVSVAVEIARGNDDSLSLALSEAYQSGQLRGSKLAAVRRIVAARMSKRTGSNAARKHDRPVTAKALVKVYEDTVSKQRALIARAERANSRILLLATAFRRLLADEDFVRVLHGEGLSDMPEGLAERVR